MSTLPDLHDPVALEAWLRSTWNEGAPVPPEMNDHPVSEVLSMFWDGGDPWGSAMAEGFAVCDFVTFHLDAQEEIPSELGYQPGMGGPGTEDARYVMLVDSFERGDFSAADAYEYLPIVERYLDACKAAGLDY